jgi:hypothetical protein
MAKKKILYTETEDVLGDGRFESSYQITEGTKYVTCTYFTNWPSDRYEYYRITKEDFTTPQGMLNDIWTRNILPCKVIESVQEIN